MALMGIFGSLISIATTLFIQNPAMPSIPGMRAIMAVTMGGMLCFFLFCAWTVVGLFRMRPWARYSILAIGGLEFCFSALLCGVMILMRNMPTPMPAAAPSPVSLQVVFLGMAAFYAFLALIGAWWLVYFNLKPVRAAFSATAQPVMAPGLSESQTIMAQPQAGTPGWRIVIIVWACLMLLSVLYVPMVFLMHVPLFMFGIILRGTPATVLILVLFAVQIVMGVGLLRKWKGAWYLALAWQVYSVVFFLSFLLPGTLARFTAYQQELMGRWGVSMTSPNANVFVNPMPFMMLGMVLGAGTVIVFTVALFQRREDYLHA
jgi:hypothetical protein